VKVGISGLVTPREWSLRETLETARAAGYEAFEVTLRDGSEIDWETPAADLAALRRMADDLGMELSALCPASSKGLNIIANEPAVRQEGKERTKRALEITAALGIDCMLMVPGAVTEEVWYDAAYERGVEGLRELAPFADQTGVTIALEYVWNRFLLSPLEFRRFCDEIGSPRVGFCFDTGNMVIFGYPEQWVRICGPHLKMVHFKDFKRPSTWTPLGEGDVDFPAVMAELRRIGYDSACLSEVDTSLASYEATAEAIRRILTA